MPRNVNTTQVQELYDTSKCSVKFRRPRILQRRDLSFDHRRRFGFDPNRKIYARLRGVIFRRKFAVGFRNLGISNLEQVMDAEDWPDVGKALPPDTLRLERRKGWDRTWGRDSGYSEKWGTTSRSWTERERPAEEIPEDENIFRTSKPRSKVTVEAEPRSAGPEEVVRRTDPVLRRKAIAFNEYALQLMETGEYSRAQSYFQKAIELDPEEPVYRTNQETCQQWLDYLKRGGRKA